MHFPKQKKPERLLTIERNGDRDGRAERRGGRERTEREKTKL